MSFEDDEYWEDEYSEYSIMPSAAVIQEKQYTKRTMPDPVIPTRRPGGSGDPVDELAERRRRRTGNRPVEVFDTDRPGWLDDPDFTPVDTSRPNLAGDEDVDYNRPELGADFDAPDFPMSSTGDLPAREDRFGDYDDDIDEPYDHRDLTAYGHGPTTTTRVGRNGQVQPDADEPADRWRGRRDRAEADRPRRDEPDWSAQPRGGRPPADPRTGRPADPRTGRPAPGAGRTAPPLDPRTGRTADPRAGRSAPPTDPRTDPRTGRPPADARPRHGRPTTAPDPRGGRPADADPRRGRPAAGAEPRHGRPTVGDDPRDREVARRDDPAAYAEPPAVGRPRDPARRQDPADAARRQDPAAYAEPPANGHPRDPGRRQDPAAYAEPPANGHPRDAGRRQDPAAYAEPPADGRARAPESPPADDADRRRRGEDDRSRRGQHGERSGRRGIWAALRGSSASDTATERDSRRKG
jgi:hypothetical protein